MHYSANRSVGIACRLSVRLSAATTVLRWLIFMTENRMSSRTAHLDLDYLKQTGASWKNYVIKLLLLS